MDLREEDIASLEYDEAYETLLRAESEELKEAFERAERILCIQPHLDDVDLAAGGLVAELSERGREVIYVTMTDGWIGASNPEISPKELAAIRMAEQKEAAK